jgi:addiction module RelB/DinJ family antitoxin
MTEQLRFRIDKRLAAEAAAVCAEIGLTPTAAVSAFFAQMVKVRGLPFQPSEFPVAKEYGASVDEIEAAESRALREIKSARRAGRVVPFTGKLTR